MSNDDKELEAMKRDAARYRWLCANNFDRPSMQVVTFAQWQEPHSATGLPQDWSVAECGVARWTT